MYLWNELTSRGIGTRVQKRPALRRRRLNGLRLLLAREVCWITLGRQGCRSRRSLDDRGAMCAAGDVCSVGHVVEAWEARYLGDAWGANDVCVGGDVGEGGTGGERGNAGIPYPPGLTAKAVAVDRDLADPVSANVAG